MKKLMDFLRERRIQPNYTQEYLAHTLGIAPSSVSRWERCEVSPSLSQIAGYAKAVGLEETEVLHSLQMQGDTDLFPRRGTFKHLL